MIRDFNSSTAPHEICGATRDAQLYSTMCIELTILAVTMLSVIVYFLRWTVGAALLSILACKHDETAPLFRIIEQVSAGLYTSYWMHCSSTGFPCA